MADEEIKPTSSIEAGGGRDNEHETGLTGLPNLPSMTEETAHELRAEARDTQTSRAHPTENPGGRPLKRFDTLPTRRNQLLPETRRRGRTLTGQTPQTTDLPPRRQIFRRGTSILSGESGQKMGPIPERRAAPAAEREGRPSGVSDHTQASGLRSRLGTIGRQRGASIRRRPTVALEAFTSGTDAGGGDNFTLAGPAPVETLVQNQPYVDPGYAHLNPAYDQPENIRPVWGLAKPLPRVLRPGMIPTRTEVNMAQAQQQQQQQQGQGQAAVDLEQGRIEPTFKLSRISTALQNARQQRENNLMEAHGLVSPTNLHSTTSRQEPLTATSQIIQEEEPTDKPTDADVTSVELHPTRPPLSFEGRLSQSSQHSKIDPFPSLSDNDDKASVATEVAGEDDLDGDWIGQEIPLVAYDANYDEEVHNLHTHWSVIRLRFREPLAELLAVTCQLTLGFCADLAVTTSGKNASPAGNEATTDWAWGLASMIGIYIAGGISGAHLNPAISIMLWIYRGFPLRKVPVYILAQILGAFIAALISFGLYQTNIIEYGGANLKNGDTMGAFITYPRYAWINASTSFFTEFVGTAILAVAVLALGDDMNAPPGAGMSAFVMGLVIVALSMAFGYNTGAALNPSRDFGPRLALAALGYGKDLFTDVYWIWGTWCAPILGAIFGAFLYDAAIFAGGESPVNYPRKRLKRAGHKWKKRWGVRLRKLKPKKAGEDETYRRWKGGQ
ncbi:hypothetical protein SBOR_5433 [Sclerotinia borealis F-4128]|uniref:Aquaporin-like protein n=1 Tax=Sclerotinia borealis (strain F-4128) TaxID=1432307 RepID=W9CHX9_SCLBF|nr:hypothetical protein SBOR_5433 [Sclerotinia borealis F-4128]